MEGGFCFLEGEFDFLRLLRFYFYYLQSFWRWLQIKNLLLNLHIQFINGVKCFDFKLVLYNFYYFLKLLMELIFTLVDSIGFHLCLAIHYFGCLLVKVCHKHFFEFINKTIDFMIAVEGEF